MSINHKQPKTLCESSTKNSLIEHFFNIIFTEFHTTPPVCVCVQMCTGQSTYCYPNGCLKRDDLKRVDSPQAASQARGDRKQYMFVVDEKNDFMKEFLEKSYMDEPKTGKFGHDNNSFCASNQTRCWTYLLRDKGQHDGNKTKPNTLN